MSRFARVTLAVVVSSAVGIGAASCTGDDPTIGEATADGATGVDAATSDATSDSLPAVDAQADAESDAPIDAPVDANIAVSGRFVSRAFDLPLAAAPLTVNGAPLLTDGAGKFSVASVTPPYTVTLSHPGSAAGGEGSTVDVFEGLTTASPTLESSRYDGSQALGVTITGTLTGIVSPIPAGTEVTVFARSTGAGVAIKTFTAGQTPTFSLTPGWKGLRTRDVIIQAFAVQTTGGAYPTAFTGYGTKTVNVTEGTVVANQDIAMTAPATKTLMGSFTPASYTGTILLYSTLQRLPRDTGGSGIGWETPATSPFSLLVPDIAGVTTGVGFYGTGGGEQRGPQAGPYNFVVSAKPVLVSPAADAILTAGTTFTWTPPAAGATGIYLFSMQKTNQDPWLYIWTKATSVKLPTSFVPTPGTFYYWHVMYIPNVTSVDAIATDLGHSLYPGYNANRKVNIP